MKLIKKIKNVYLFLCNSIKELDECIVQQFIEEMQLSNHTTLGLTASNDVSNIYTRLIDESKTKNINFKKVCSYNLEEFVEFKKDKNCFTYHNWMDKHFFNFINIKKKHIHFPSDFGLIEICRYDRQMWKVGGVDLLLLSLNHNEDIRKNDLAKEDYNDLTHIVKLTKEMKNVIINEYSINKEIDVADYLITIGIRTILNAKRIIICAKGKECAKKIKYLAKGIFDKKIPITSLLTHRDVRIYMDKDAAELII